MRRALALARESAGLASPNPQVGCVLVLNAFNIGEGAHLYDRLDHAEIVALKHAQVASKVTAGATAYVTLEPCSHHGRTGPCADALLRAGIVRCVVATLDPNPAVAGRGVARLRAAGVEVETGLCQAEARALNNAFALSITRHRPFVTLKSALSADGFLAPAPAARTAANPFWLTGLAARAEVQKLRHAHDAILTGIGTVLADDPALTDRSGLPRRRPLQRIVLDRHLRIPLSSKLVQTAQNDLQLLCSPTADPTRRQALEARGIPVLPAENLSEVLGHLHHSSLLSVLLEAGPTLNAAFLWEHLVDALVLHYAPSRLGAGAIPFAQNGPTPFALEQRLTQLSRRTLGPDTEVAGLLQDPWPATDRFI